MLLRRGGDGGRELARRCGDSRRREGGDGMKREGGEGRGAGAPGHLEGVGNRRFWKVRRL